ncbi:repressor [Vibrio sp. MACH09]|uniref:LexA family protein n=1 Tax=unclassified Vibrio TaxID=2614977 RepID=UPI0014935315|nr:MULTISPECIES: S24 family peptidase [unclassified Vibrio]NOI66894.1 LexA family transcriptional repressor [Vibrio sp. 99-8-1]GLO62977.1 repressor [Vibrio sp. MACH09]
MDRYEVRRLNLIKLKDELCGGKIAEVARRIDRSPSYVSRMLMSAGNPGKKPISEKMVELINTGFRLPQGAFDHPDFDPNSIAPPPEFDFSNVSEVPESIEIKNKYPVISAVTAGTWAEAVEPYQRHEIDEYLLTTEKASDNAFWLKVVGDSMSTLSGISFPDGMYILIDPEVEAINQSYVVAKLKSVNEATFKQLVIDVGQKFLKPLNPDPMYKPIPINGDCKIVGVVIDAKWKLR